MQTRKSRISAIQPVTSVREFRFYTVILHQFPDLQWLKKQAEDNFANRKDYAGRTLPTDGWPTVLLNVKSESIFRDNIRGPLSIFTNLSGSSVVACNGKRSNVHQGFFFVTNHDQRYSLEIEAGQEVETFNIHFGEYWIDQALATLRSEKKLIDDQYFIAPGSRHEFYNRLQPVSAEFSALVHQLKLCSDSLQEEELLYEILVLLLRSDQRIRGAEQRLPSLKISTREEVTKRLMQSTDYIYSFFDRDLTLDELAQASCMSKFHFLRLFKTAFGKTPHQFVNDVKIEQAKARLKQNKAEIIDISRQLGFKDASTFSRAFKKTVGVWPREYRG